MTPMMPTYQMRVWQDDGWWLARVVAASEGTDQVPLNAITQARTLARIESMGRDLIATILDADELTFHVEFDYVLPGNAGEFVGLAKDAREWLDAAQHLWQERSALAARALTEQGYSLREAAVLLGLSHQRVDQLLGAQAETEPSRVAVFQGKAATTAGSMPLFDAMYPTDVNVILVVRRDGQPWSAWNQDESDISLKERITALVTEVSWRISRHSIPMRLGNANAK